MIIKLLGVIATILVILMSIFIILKVNSEENIDNSVSDVDKFVGKWRLINSEADEFEDEIPDTSAEPNNFVGYETYEFISNGTYCHEMDEKNASGVWEINNSMLVLKVNEPSGVLPLSYKFVFSDDNHRVTLNLFEDPENFMELEKISL